MGAADQGGSAASPLEDASHIGDWNYSPFLVSIPSVTLASCIRGRVRPNCCAGPGKFNGGNSYSEVSGHTVAQSIPEEMLDA